MKKNLLVLILSLFVWNANAEFNLNLKRIAKPFDAFARKNILIEKLECTSGTCEKKISLSSFGKGMYLVRIQSNKAQYIERVIVQ